MAALFHPTAVSQVHASHEELPPGSRGDDSVRAEDDDSATPSTSPSRSPSPSLPAHRALLDKPLEQLTEEDIMHLTREDCRRYLKQKGMRRPSWNKSQAIQQVLSLKGLFDTKDDEEKGFQSLTRPKKLSKGSSYTQDAPTPARGVLCLPQKTMVSASKQLPSTENVGHDCASSGKMSQRQERRDVYAARWPTDAQQKCLHTEVSTAINTLSRSSSDQFTATFVQLKESNFSSPRDCSQCDQTSSGLMGMEHSAQLTIFYSGMVNVYDNVPEDKARAIMLLAARSNMSKPLLYSHSEDLTSLPGIPQDVNASSCSMPHYVHSTVATTEICSTAACPSVPVVQSSKATGPEYQLSRKACLQRYLEKRRGRYSLRTPNVAPTKRADGWDHFSSQLMSERYNFSSFLEMMDPLLVSPHDSCQVQLPAQSSSEREAIFSSPMVMLQFVKHDSVLASTSSEKGGRRSCTRHQEQCQHTADSP